MASSIHRGSKQTHLSKKKTADTKRQKKGYEAEGETLVDLQGISWDSRQEKKREKIRVAHWHEIKDMSFL